MHRDGTVPSRKKHRDGSVPSRKKHHDGTVENPPGNFHITHIIQILLDCIFLLNSTKKATSLNLA